MEKIKLDQEALNHIDAYADYVYHGGEQIGQYNPENYQLLKQKMAQGSKPYINWRNSKGRDCKNIGPATKCFCDHRLKQHDYLDPKDGKVKCLENKCSCKHFYYIPIHGSQDFRCLCKHSYRDHKNISKQCRKCKTCKKFGSAWSCSCKLKFGEHDLVVEYREDRIKEGRFVSEVEGIMMKQQQIKNFTDLVDYSESYDAKVDKFNEMKQEMGMENKMLKQGENQNSILLQLLLTPHNYQLIFMIQMDKQKLEKIRQGLIEVIQKAC